VSYKGQYHYRTGSTKQELKGASLNQFLLRKQGKHWDSVPKPSVHQSIPFNPSIAEVFFRAGFVESWGRGIDTIVDLSLSYGNEAPRFSNELGGLEVNFFSQKIADYLPDKSSGNTQILKEEGSGKMPGKMPGKSSRMMLKKMASNPNITIPELANNLGLKIRTVEKKIKNLKDNGLLERVGPAKGGYWKVLIE